MMPRISGRCIAPSFRKAGPAYSTSGLRSLPAHFSCATSAGEVSGLLFPGSVRPTARRQSRPAAERSG